MVNIPAQYQKAVAAAAAALGIPVGVVAAQINAESGFQTGVTSPAGAEGIAQFLPSTWQGLGCSGSPYNAADSFKCYIKYMGQLLRQFHGNIRDALAAYNAGPGNLAAGYGYADSILAAANQPQNITGGGGGSGASGVAQTTGLITDITDPFHIIYGIGQTIAGLVSSPASLATSVTSIAQDVAGLSKVLYTILNDALWLFKPSNWVRIFAFIFGVGALLPGIWMLSKAGRGEGDISLALGILLVIVSGILLFVAFHSLPEDIKSFQDLLGYISSEVRKNSPATTG